MKIYLFITLWSLAWAASSGLLWKKSGSRKKIYALFLTNAIYLSGIFWGCSILTNS